MFDKRFRSTVREFGMIKKRDRIAVGLSGGKDSTVLLNCLHELSKNLPMELLAITIDEGISGYRSATLKIAKAEAKKLGIEHHVISFKNKVGKTLDSILKTDQSRACSYCGIFRRTLLNRAARDLGANKLALGHNLDDLAQTVLMNIMKNEAERNARYLSPKTSHPAFVPRIRPLLRTPEKEVAIYAMAREINIDHRECPYAHNAFRQTIRRQLNELEELYPGTKHKILASYLSMGKEREANSSKIENVALRGCISCKEPCSGETCMFCQMKSGIRPIKLVKRI
jgi:uncharacterized protein (TIGR00269 family)